MTFFDLNKQGVLASLNGERARSPILDSEAWMTQGKNERDTILAWLGCVALTGLCAVMAYGFIFWEPNTDVFSLVSCVLALSYFFIALAILGDTGSFREGVKCIGVLIALPFLAAFVATFGIVTIPLRLRALRVMGKRREQLVKALATREPVHSYRSNRLRIQNPKIAKLVGLETVPEAARKDLEYLERLVHAEDSARA